MFLVGSLYKDLLPKGVMAANAPVVAISTNTTTVGAIIDTQGFARVLFNMLTKIVTDGDYEVQLFHSADSGMSGEVEVLASDINGTIPNWVADTDDNKYVSFEYICRLRYLRIKIVSTNVTTGVDAIGGIASLGQASKQPQQT